MFRNYLVVAIRNLFRQKAYSLINVSGLTIGMACCLLILLFVQHELSYDRYHNRADRICRVLKKKRNDPRAPFLLARTLVDRLPEVVQAVRFTSKRERLVRHKDKRFIEKAFLYVDPDVFDVFSFTLTKGDPRTALTEPFSIVITEQTARKYFGNESPIDKILTVENKHNYRVTGVLDDIPGNSHFRFDFLATFVGAEKVFEPGFFDDWDSASLYTYLLLAEGCSLPQLEMRIWDEIVKPMKERNPGLHLSLDLQVFSCNVWLGIC